MNRGILSVGINFEEIARCTEDFSGAMLRAVCVEAGMLALRRGASSVEHEDFMEGIRQVAARRKGNLMYYAYMCFFNKKRKEWLILEAFWNASSQYIQQQ